MAAITATDKDKPELPSVRKPVRPGRWRPFRKNWDLYLLAIPVLIYFIIFEYFPMYGLQIAFKNFVASKGIWGSPWVGLVHFERFFDSYYFWRLIENTLGIGIYELVVGFPLPILLALMINEVKNGIYRRFVQTVTYAPHFLSTVVLVGLIFIFLSPQTGIVNQLIKLFGGDPVSFMMSAGWFKTIYVLSGAWQHMGWSSIIYLAALAGVDQQLHEAARVDGASRIRRIWHINLPGIMPTIVTLLILNVGRILSVGFEKVFLMQNQLNMETSDIIATHVYRMGIAGAQYSYSTAVGLFNAVITFIMLIVVNYLARKVNETSLW
ncbi:sugar ABC transporter permease [Paenibacillus sp. Soil766]|uniref:ABC transporter permease n=1 Tax=Paenibacillus sp. Soil766 TaxID=1736404 RepID=UPI0007096CE4|nr:ABC transporter permease subunit [Paenibacillus sp. Soil766]KRE95874.1 sugar ABC transporter permease [Paenibacillus sp. Soil766]